MKRWLAIALAVFSINGCTSGAGTANPAMDSSVPLDATVQQDTGAPPPDADAPPFRRPEDVILDDAGLAAYTVEVLADVEGDWNKVTSFLRKSNLLQAPPGGDDDEGNFTLKGTVGTFVYLGDSVDNGPNDLKVLRFLTGLKKHHADRVVLILGNRDINKLRFLWDLKDEALNLSDGLAKYAYDHFRIMGWATDFADFFTIKAPRKAYFTVGGVELKDRSQYKDGLVPTSVPSDRIIKTKFLLAATLGAGDAFQNAATELAAAGKPNEEADVVQFFIDLPNTPEMKSFLTLGQLIYYDKYVHGLFAHGGIPNSTETGVGYVPPPGAKIEVANEANLIAWTDALNAWAQARIADSYNGNYDAGMPIVDYQEPLVQTLDGGVTTWVGPLGPNVPNPTSVVQTRPWVGGDIGLVSDDVQDRLTDAGVTRLVFGHTPVGEVPVPMKSTTHNFVEIAADTSFSTPERRNSTIILTPTNFVIFSQYYTSVDPADDTATAQQVYSYSTNPDLGTVRRGNDPKQVAAAIADALDGGLGADAAVAPDGGYSQVNVWNVGQMNPGDAGAAFTLQAWYVKNRSNYYIAR